MGEDRLQTSLELDRMPARAIVDLIQSEDSTISEAMRGVAEDLANVIEAVADRLRHGGRMYYVGAGTSGRIAMLDAAELRPTFGVPPDLVRVIMAGGPDAFFSAVEGAEDREEEAIAEIDRLVTADDCVVGIAASGNTPFTLAAVRRANMIGALTVGITSSRVSHLPRECDFSIVLETGPEVIMGSTRMKSGTAQKLALNTLSTGIMVLLGHVYSNLMIDMPPTNRKLHRRAISMVAMAANVSTADAERALAACEGHVKEAAVVAKLGVSPTDARARLSRHDGNLREALED